MKHLCMSALVLLTGCGGEQLTDPTGQMNTDELTVVSPAPDAGTPASSPDAGTSPLPEQAVADAGCGGAPMNAPPPAALMACANLSAGAACSFLAPDRMVSGHCQSGPNGEPLACAPPRPPPEALAACAGLQAAVSCSFQAPDRMVNGKCQSLPTGELVCVPPPPPPEALAACVGVGAGAACSFQSPNGTVSGVCKPGPQGAPSACVP